MTNKAVLLITLMFLLLFGLVVYNGTSIDRLTVRVEALESVVDGK